MDSNPIIDKLWDVFLTVWGAAIGFILSNFAQRWDKDYQYKILTRQKQILELQAHLEMNRIKELEQRKKRLEAEEARLRRARERLRLSTLYIPWAVFLLGCGVIVVSLIRNISLTPIIVTSPTANPIVLEGVLMANNVFDGNDLKRALLADSDFEGASFQEACMMEAVLDRSNLREANLYFANLQGASLIDAILADARLHLANLENARLDNGDLRGATLSLANLRGATLEGALFDESTRLPDNRFWNPNTDLGRYTDPNPVNFWPAPTGGRLTCGIGLFIR